MNDYNCKNKFECDECSIKGICSLSPVAAAMKSVIFAFLQELAFYIIKVRMFGGRNEHIKNNFIEIFSILISNSEYTEDGLNSIINNIFETLIQVKILYQDLCKKNNTLVKYYKTQVRLNKNFTVAEIVKKGHKYSTKIKQNFTEEQRNGLDSVLIILKSICLYLVELQNLEFDIDNYYMELLSAIEVYSFEEISHEQIIEYLKKFAKLDSELMRLLYKIRQERYGEFVQADVLFSHKKGKAILVSGTNMKEMEMILEATKDKGLDIYTHGQMITAHTLPKLRAYSHLVGHYGKDKDSYMTDFSSFPGAVFLTKLSLFKVENLYRGGIFTTDKIVASGIGRIKDYDFEPLIKSALSAEGFEDASETKVVKFGFTEEEIDNKNNELVEKIKRNEIKTIFLVGVPSSIDYKKEYFDQLFSLINNESYIYSLFPGEAKENAFFLRVDFGHPLLYRLLDLILPIKKHLNTKINLLLTRCDSHTIPGVIDVKNLDLDNVYMGVCSPNLFNPALIQYIMSTFSINKYTTPEADYKAMTED